MSSQKRVTISHIAERAGVSTGTVSMVLNDNPLVAKATREYVRSVIRELGYVYDRGAAQLRKGKTNIVGVSICNLRNPYFSEVAAGIEESLDELGQMLVICNSGESVARQTRFLTTLREYSVAGVLMIPVIGTKKADIAPLIEWRLPFVTVTRYVRGVAADFAGIDNRHAAALATRHLIELGHTRIAYVGVNRLTSTGQDRIAGYRKAMRDARLPEVPEFIIEGPGQREVGYEGARKLMLCAHPPTAFVCFNDLVAFGAMLALRQLGLEPGHDCSVIGMDDVTESALWMPPLTTVASDPPATGRAAGRALLERIAAPDAPVQRIVLPPRLIVRSSCGPVPSTRAPASARRRKARGAP